MNVCLTALLCNRKIFLLSEEFLQVRQRESFFLVVLDGLIGVRDEGDEERQHHVDEQGDEGVEVGPAEEPHQNVFVLQLCEGGEHVVTVQQREQALRYTTQALELERWKRRDWILRKLYNTINSYHEGGESR